MQLKDRNLAVTDIETSGVVFAEHEILEIGLVVVHPETLEITDTFSAKIKPEHIGNAVPAALEKNGYREENWKDAVPLREAMEQYASKTRDAVFCAYNVSFDWGFMSEAFRKTEVQDPMDYHRLDIMSMAYLKYGNRLESLTLDSISELIGIPKEPIPHSALNGALQAYHLLFDIMKKRETVDMQTNEYL